MFSFHFKTAFKLEAASRHQQQEHAPLHTEFQEERQQLWQFLVAHQIFQEE